MILRYWREIALAKELKQKEFAQKKKGKGLLKKGNSNAQDVFSSEITKADFFELFETISKTEQVFFKI